jgi:hypothetical protein
MVKDFLCGLTITYLGTFANFFAITSAYSRHSGYYRASPPPILPLLVVALVLIVCAFAYAILLRGLRSAGPERLRQAGRYMPLAALIAALLPGVGLPAAILEMFLAHLVRLALLAALLWVMWKRHDSVVRWAVHGMTFASTLFPVMVAGAAYDGLQIRSLNSASRLPSLEASGKGPRLVWLLLDELDYRMVVEHPPAGITFPEFDRLRSVSITATQAYPPGEWTKEVIPELLIGRDVAEVKEVNDHSLELHFSGAQPVLDFSSVPNLFDKARAMGKRSALSGWYHPYCRLIGKSLDACSWQPMNDATTYQRTLWTAAEMGPAWTVRTMLETPLGGLFEYWRNRQLGDELRLARRGHMESFRRIHKTSMSLLADPAYDLVFLHYNIPHPVGTFDRRSRKLSAEGYSNYVDNLVLSDQVLGEIRARLCEAGLEDRTWLMVTSDHSYRAGFWSQKPTWTAEMAKLTQGRQDHRVMFLVHGPGWNQPVQVTQRLSSLLAHPLALELLAGRVSTVAEVSGWLRQQLHSPTPGHQ